MAHETARTTVGVALAPPLADEVTAWVEAEAGWEVVGPDGPPAPRLVLADRVWPDRPTVVVRDGAVDAELVRTALDEGAVDVLAWPDERQRLLAAPARVRTNEARRPVATVRVAGLAGGVGASTVAMGIAGLLAWSGRETIVVGDAGTCLLAGIGRWSGPGAAEVAALAPGDAAEEVAALAVPVPGVPGLRLLGGSRAHDRIPGTDGWPGDVVVVDAGRTPDGGELVVAAADARLVAARDVTGSLVVVGERPLSPAQAAHVAGRRPAAVVPWSARVVAAALRGRVPADLPGSWLRRLGRALTATHPGSGSRA